MSIEVCRCGSMIDTDHDDSAYEITDENGFEIKVSYPLCNDCRDKFTDLVLVKSLTDKFISDIFDHVRSAGDVGILTRLYEFRRNVENKIDPKNAKGTRL